MRSQAYDECQYRILAASGFFSMVLCCSEFGDHPVEFGSAHVPDCFQRPAAKLYCFCFRLCELWKANTYKLSVYYPAFKDKDVRRVLVQKLVSSGHIIVKHHW